MSLSAMGLNESSFFAFNLVLTHVKRVGNAFDMRFNEFKTFFFCPGIILSFEWNVKRLYPNRISTNKTPVFYLQNKYQRSSCHKKLK
jgi:hypothetical protein